MSRYLLLLLATTIQIALAVKCGNDKFACGNGKKCVSQNWFCDNDNDCGDHSDDTRRNKSEVQTGIPCRRDRYVCMLPERYRSRMDDFCKKNIDCDENELPCPDGSACLSIYAFCAGRDDCKDGSYKIKRNYSLPAQEGLPCRRGSDVCMLPFNLASKKALLCTKNPDCEDDEFMCADGSKCISLNDFCDGSKDCSDGSDEIKASSNVSGIPCRLDDRICVLPDRLVARKEKFCKKDVNCDKNQFRCTDGNQCLPASDFCDGTNDCDDESDEVIRDLTLDSIQPGTPCRRANSICMFPEKSDSEQQKSICKKDLDCDNDEFSCMDGSGCVAQNEYCNGVNDCRDGSDEVLFKSDSPVSGTKCRRKNLMCVLPLSQADKKDKLCPKGTKCRDNEFACLDGSQCLPKVKFCDGTAHCSDKSDEIKIFHPDANVTGIICRQTTFACLLHDNETSKESNICKKKPKCGPTEFTCSDELQCLPRNKFCDGVVDCRDGSDELKRNRSKDTDFEAVPCRQHNHVCWLPKTQLAKKSKLCQKAAKCSKKEFACSDGMTCLPFSAFCNGTAECIDGSDEIKEGFNNPAAVNGSRCRQERYKCILPDSQKTKRTTICKKKFECADNEFGCLDNTQCLPSWWFCDGYSDCDDGSDEMSVGSATDGLACRRDKHVCLLPQNQMSKKVNFCRRPV